MSRPKNVVGWYIPRDPVEWTGEVLDLKTGELVKEPSMTKQSFKEECDVNNIIRKFDMQVATEHLQQAMAAGLFSDLPDPFDYQEAMNHYIQANQAFGSLSADVRKRFDNDPQAFLEFFHDPANQEEAIKLGLATDLRVVPPEAPPTKVEIVNAKVDEKEKG